MQDKDISFLKKMVLKLLTFFQENTIKQDNVELYYKFTKLHFRVYFGYPLNYNAPVISKIRVADRHAKMVLNLLYPNVVNKDMIYCNAYESFLKNLAAETSLERMY